MTLRHSETQSQDRSAADAGNAGLRLVLAGAVIAFLTGLLAVGFGLRFLGVMGGTPLAAEWVAWTYLAIGLVSVGGGEIGLRAYRRGRTKDLHGAYRQALVASFMPPIQLVLLIGAMLCRGAAKAQGPSEPREDNPFLR